MRVLAYTHGAAYATALAQAFAAGCKRHGQRCEVKWAEGFNPREGAEVVWLFGLLATEAVFDAYEGRAVRVTGDLGYWRERASELPLERRPVRIAIDAQQPDAHLQLRAHSGDRYRDLKLNVLPVRERGESVLVTGQSAEQARRYGYAYGAWEAATVERVRRLTAKPIVVRESPSSAPLDIPGTTRSMETDAASAIRASWAVVCRSGNIGADCILHGVPVFAESGPGAVYAPAPLETIETALPLAAGLRLRALADLAYWQWSQREIESGALWAHLREEGIF